ncbi:MAG: PIG-L family deacetylase [Rhodanobacter sp.]
MAKAPSIGLPAFSAHTRLLVVAPHPDDETIAAGLLIQQVRAAGGEVQILLLTGGDNNPWPQRWLEHRLRIGAPERRRWAQRRQVEMRQALEVLGLTESALQALDWPDMGLTELLLQPGGQAVAMVARRIDAFAPDLIAFPSLTDRHPDHGAAHVLVRLALLTTAARPLLLAYLVHGQASASTFVEIPPTPAQVSAKRLALLEHHSQMALSGTRLRQLAERAEHHVEQRLSSTATSTVLPWKPPSWLRPWLRLSVVCARQAHQWSWRDAPLQRTADGSFELCLPVDEGTDLCFAKLSCSLRSPWIFDHWGWCELRTGAGQPAG